MQTTIEPNWENSPESWLAEIKIGEVCVDFAPDAPWMNGEESLVWN